METLSVITALREYLRELNPDMDVSISTQSATDYIPLNNRPAVLIHYSGADFAATESTDAVVQRRTLHFTATVIAPQADALNALDRTRQTLGGIALPGCDRLLWMKSETFIGNNAGFACYALEMASSALFIANQESKDLPLLTIVNYEEIQ